MLLYLAWKFKDVFPFPNYPLFRKCFFIFRNLRNHLISETHKWIFGKKKYFPAFLFTFLCSLYRVLTNVFYLAWTRIIWFLDRINSQIIIFSCQVNILIFILLFSFRMFVCGTCMLKMKMFAWNVVEFTWDSIKNDI